MNNAQIKAIQNLTNRVDRAARYMTIGNDYMNGPVVSRASAIAGNKVLVQISNATDELRWFNSSVHVMAIVGPRGGVTLSDVEGVVI